MGKVMSQLLTDITDLDSWRQLDLTLFHPVATKLRLEQ